MRLRDRLCIGRSEVASLGAGRPLSSASNQPEQTSVAPAQTAFWMSAQA